jgi:hypothetical protein
VQNLLGHADLRMSMTYIQDVSKQTDEAINKTRNLIMAPNNSSSELTPGSNGNQTEIS